MQGQPSFCVLICVHSEERTELSVAAIRSAEAQSLRPSEIIVVSDHNPRLAEILASRCPGVRVIMNTGRQGLSGARNTGCMAATADIVAFLDDDAEAAPDWLERMAAHYADPAVMGAGGHAEPAWPGERPGWFPKEFEWVIGCSYRGLPETVAPVRNLIGCNMSFRRSVITVLGGFREALGREGGNAFGCEETDFCIRAGDVFPSSRILYDPAIKVRHHVTPLRTQWAYFQRRCLAEGRSKAIVVNRNGRKQGLASERRYVMKILPSGVFRGLADLVTGGSLDGLKRAGAIVGGLFLTTWGYADFAYVRKGKIASPDHFQPIRILDIDLDQPVADSAPAADVREYGGAFILARRNGRPAATIELPLIRNITDGEELRTLIEARLPAPASQPVPFPTVVRPVSVIVATRDRPEQLARCLDSLLGQTHQDFEIVVVDNAPSDNRTQQMLASHYADEPRIRYHREMRPGLAQAHNAGVAVARHELMAFTDDDVICGKGWLAALMSGFEAAPHVGCVTGLIVPMELETRAQYWTERHGGFGKGFRRQIFDNAGHRRPGPLYPLTAGQFGSGAAMAYRLSTLKRIGMFDAALGAGTKARGGDDISSFAEVILSGDAIVYEPAAVTWHQHRREEEGMHRQAHGYGVGLGAYLASMVWKHPALGWTILKGLPAAFAHMVGPSSEKIARLPSDYPKSYVWRERLGILSGPWAYYKSRKALAAPVSSDSGPRFMPGAIEPGAKAQ